MKIIPASLFAASVWWRLLLVVGASVLLWLGVLWTRGGW